MDVIGAVAAGAAGLAAVLAGVNLYVSDRREKKKWAEDERREKEQSERDARREQERWERDALIKNLALFLDASFKIGSNCHTILRESPPPAERARLSVAALAAHDAGGDAMTRLRLLAPADVVDAANRVRIRETELALACCPEQTKPTKEDELSSNMREAREEFLQSSRKALSLDKESGTDFANSKTWRPFRVMVSQMARDKISDTAT